MSLDKAALDAIEDLEERALAKKTTGLIEKYFVARVDGKPVGWAFVLEDSDPLAVPALEMYAHAARDAGYFQLADDLADKVGELRERHQSRDGGPASDA